MRKKFMQITSIIMVFVLIVSCTGLFASAEDNKSYPNIFVTGMMGWDKEDTAFEGLDYWGLSAEDGNLIDKLNEMGYESYSVSTGPISSAWDRACELYAQLTGTVTDYGEAHSEAHNHSRYGKSYEGKAVIDNFGETKINLFGHSFGGNTIRLFTYILENGNDEELAKSGDNASEFFKGGKGSFVNSVTTLSSPHNGSMVANVIYSIKLSIIAFGAVANLIAAINPSSFDFKLPQFGLTSADGEKTHFNFCNIKKFAEAEDNCGYDLTLGGSSKLNDSMGTVDGVYYFSYSCCGTQPSKIGNFQVPADFLTSSFRLTALMIGFSEGKTYDGVTITSDWLASDGIVPVKSAQYPLTEAHADYDENTEIDDGIWYVMPVIEGGHNTLMGNGAGAMNMCVQMYSEHIKTMNNLG